MRYVRSNKTITGRLRDELVMMDMEQGKYFGLNSVAARIWEILEVPMDIEGLCQVLTDEYDVDADVCRHDVEEHLAEMEGLGLVTRGS
ncbi:MAG: PqqD family protein [Bacteroidales bacterium]|nr:PqqD family protein [Bacteroidales bacterium]